MSAKENPIVRGVLKTRMLKWFAIPSPVDHVCQAVCYHPAHITYMQRTSCEMQGWMKHKLESRLPGELSITSDMQMTTSLWLKAKRTKEPSDESERGE